MTVEKRPTTQNELLDKVDEFKCLWKSDAPRAEKNKAFKLLVDKMVYDRVDNLWDFPDISAQLFSRL